MDPKQQPPPEPTLAQAELDFSPGSIGRGEWLLPVLPDQEDTEEDAPADLAPDAIDAQPAAIDEADDRFESLDDPRIPPGQSYFKIGEVAKIIGVKPYVLRYWEGEFPWVRPEKTSSRQRRYRRQDVAMLLTIRRLRHDEQLPVARARELIQEMKRSGRKRPQKPKPPTVRLLPEEVVGRVDPALLRRRLAEMRQALMELLSAVEE
jgi:DNA-binding transcriptional MerR regulator